ncbi:MAG: hypothetical protein JO190_10520 [Candidatus Eremiobacteraeota bacterium]|nr:hypothetical protein [Candidatus Eremiobacteraeota bacterium]MBV8498118.1 hypothetical protein [Candidatus Eremiobacteraeota bacterium]
MRYRLAYALIVLGAALPLPGLSASPMAAGTIGVGPHGYDVLVGTWTCKNSVPSAMGGPAVTTVVIAHSINGALSVHVNGTNFDALGYVIYAPKTKTWWNPASVVSGGYGTESTQQTGKKTTWAGPFTDPSSGKTTQVRDTYTFTSPTTYTDLYQVETNGTWKTEGNSTCTRG